jgi:hypothetical protein
MGTPRPGERAVVGSTRRRPQENAADPPADRVVQTTAATVTGVGYTSTLRQRKSVVGGSF